MRADYSEKYRKSKLSNDTSHSQNRIGTYRNIGMSRYEEEPMIMLSLFDKVNKKYMMTKIEYNL